MTLTAVLAALCLGSVSVADDDDERKCELSMNPGSVSIAWNPGTDLQAITFTVSKRKSSSCKWAATFTRGGASDYSSRRMVSGANTLRYQLYKDTTQTTILKDYPDVSSVDEVLSGTFSGGSNLSQTVSYYVNLPNPNAGNQPLQAGGSYSDTFTIKLYEVKKPTTINNATLAQSTPIVISTNVPKSVEISITPSGGSFDPGSTSRAVDFGNLSTGQESELDLQVRSNAGYQLSLTSLNGGKMKPVSGTSNSSISYTMKIGAQTYNLGNGPVTVAQGSGQTTSSGIRYSTKVVVGSVDDKLAGRYTDSITVTATTTE